MLSTPAKTKELYISIMELFIYTYWINEQICQACEECRHEEQIEREQAGRLRGSLVGSEASCDLCKPAGGGMTKRGRCRPGWAG